MSSNKVTSYTKNSRDLEKLIELKITTVKKRFKEFLEQDDLESLKVFELKYMIATTL